MQNICEYTIREIKEVSVVHNNTNGNFFLHCVCEVYGDAWNIAKQNIDYSLSIVDVVMFENNVWYVPFDEPGQKNALFLNNKWYVPFFQFVK